MPRACRPAGYQGGGHPLRALVSPHLAVRSLPARFALGVLAPQLLFYCAWRSEGLIPALVAAAAWTAGLQGFELARRKMLDPFLVYGLLLTLAQGAASLFTHNPLVYAGAGIVENVIWAVLLLGSVTFCRPLVVRGWRMLAGERASLAPAAEAALWSLAWVWGVLFLARSAGLYVALTHLPMGQFLVVNTVAGWPVNGLALLVTLRYLPMRV
jgi:hypothetical protein